MATAIAPSTPKAQILQSSVATPSPGNWSHPQLDEIERRQNANVLGEGDIKKMMWNGFALVFLWLFGDLASSLLKPSWYSLVGPHSAQGTFLYARLALFSLFMYNIAMALAPALKPKDDMSDIPLTPTQRAALGLDPNATPPPNSVRASYITPPRYARSPTPRKSSSGSRSGSPANSLGSRRGSPLSGRQGGDSPFSPSASPLWQKKVGDGHDTSRRHSYGSPLALGPGSGKDISILGAPSTPSPSTGRGTSVGLNSKWLYERGRASPGR